MQLTTCTLPPSQRNQKKPKTWGASNGLSTGKCNHEQLPRRRHGTAANFFRHLCNDLPSVLANTCLQRPRGIIVWKGLLKEWWLAEFTEAFYNTASTPVAFHCTFSSQISHKWAALFILQHVDAANFWLQAKHWTTAKSRRGCPQLRKANWHQTKLSSPLNTGQCSSICYMLMRLIFCCPPHSETCYWHQTNLSPQAEASGLATGHKFSTKRCEDSSLTTTSSLILEDSAGQTPDNTKELSRFSTVKESKLTPNQSFTTGGRFWIDYLTQV